MLLLALYYLLEQRVDKLFWGLVVWSLAGLLLNAGVYGWGWKVGGVLAFTACQPNIARITWLAVRRKKEGAWIIGMGVISYMVFFTAFLVSGMWGNDLFNLDIANHHYTVSLQPVWVQMDSDKLEQIISNLFANAYKFTPTNGQVRFSASVEPWQTGTCELQLIVQDTGIGIAEHQLSRIFDRFYQVDDSDTRSYEGTGIGLALVAELVELHGGHIQAESTLGSGTTFRVHLPFETVPGRIAPGRKALSRKFPCQNPRSRSHPRLRWMNSSKPVSERAVQDTC